MNEQIQTILRSKRQTTIFAELCATHNTTARKTVPTDKILRLMKAWRWLAPAEIWIVTYIFIKIFIFESLTWVIFRMGLLEDCENFFGTDDLYKVLQLDRDATPAAIKKAYYKFSLKFHPGMFYTYFESSNKNVSDKSTDENLASNTARFQCLSKIHKLLSGLGSISRKTPKRWPSLKPLSRQKVSRSIPRTWWYWHWRFFGGKCTVGRLLEKSLPKGLKQCWIAFADLFN